MKRRTGILHYWNEWKIVQYGDPVTSTRSRYRGPLATGGKTRVLQIAGTVLGKRFRRSSGISLARVPLSFLSSLKLQKNATRYPSVVAHLANFTVRLPSAKVECALSMEK